jgi:hypothetical protein
MFLEGAQKQAFDKCFSYLGFTEAKINFALIQTDDPVIL